MIIDEMGYFWWDDSIDSAVIAPGHLIIDENGSISLEMHGSLGDDSEFNALFGQTSLNEKRIRGELKKSGKKILLTNIITNGATVGRISYANYRPNRCYVSRSEIELDNLCGLHFPLTGLEGWFQPGKVELSEPTHDRIDLTLDLSSGKKWMLDAGVLRLVTAFEGSRPSVTSHNINIGMRARFEYIHNEIISADALLDWSTDLSDFISLLSNSLYVSCHPSVIWENNGEIYSAECYFQQITSPEKNINWHEVRLPLLRIEADFGRLLQAWFNKKRSLGPGINLFLGAIKNQHLFAENRFVNMIWGLESLDRRSESSPRIIATDKLNKKSQRVFQAINGKGILKSKDKRWLLNLLERSQEPSLAERLNDVLSPIAAGFNIEPSRLRIFCEECAHLRNDMSHHGGERTLGEYDAFILKLIPRMYALEKFYPLVIFDLIGIENEQMVWIMHKNHRSFQMKKVLKNVGLLTDEQFKY
ncbi:hypothetical protein C7420_101728 [Pantoea ananatis]|uniref:ApeA N-terminal domain 1-containing protein n=1 Tax=Pantoea ananas TaxID=553 RepID=UPI000DC2CF43|nr:HEPN domain-containing protein [Pantoea ananatis]RAR75112.1 hypothetical protein C7420_101728 [Pantoea ananatis]